MKHTADTLLAIGTVVALISCSPDSVTQDTTPPELQIGKETDTVYIGMEWEEPGYLATDNVDGSLTDEVTVSGTVTTGAPGTVHLVYQVTDEAGNSTEEERAIIVIPDPTMVAWYPLGGDALDYSGHGLDGTIEGSLQPEDDRFETGGSSWLFNGSSFIEVPYDSRLDLTDAFTLSVWAKSDIEGSEYASVDGGSGFVFNMGSGGENDYGLFYYPNNHAMTFRYNHTDIVCDTSVAITEWHHYAMTYDGSTFRGYVDGNNAGDFSTGKGNILDLPFRIGCESKNVNRMWKGAIDDLIIYRTALSPQQIASLSRCAAFTPDTPCESDSLPPDTTTDPNGTIAAPEGITAVISGTTGDLTLKISWNEVPGAFAYGIYYAKGKTVSKDDYYRVSNFTYKTFSSDLSEGETYTFAVITFDGNEESELSDPLTVTFSEQ